VYIGFWLPIGTFLLSLNKDAEGKIIWISSVLIFLIHSITLVGQILLVNYIGSKNVNKLENPSSIKLWSAIIYASLPVIIIVSYWLSRRIWPDALFIYLLGLIAVFGGLIGLMINCEFRSNRLSEKYLIFLYSERIQLIWPYTFGFFITLLGSPFVALTLSGVKLSETIALLSIIWVGTIGFATLIIMPLDNVRDIREELNRRGYFKDK
jgi:hypothetical protein